MRYDKTANYDLLDIVFINDPSHVHSLHQPNFCPSPSKIYQKGGTVSKAYGTSLSIPGFGTFSNRRTFIIDPQKIVRWVFVDVEGRIPKHPSDVLEKLLELQQQSQ